MQCGRNRSLNDISTNGNKYDLPSSSWIGNIQKDFVMAVVLLPKDSEVIRVDSLIILKIIINFKSLLFTHHSQVALSNTESRKNLDNSFFNWAHSLHTELINVSHSTNSFANSCDHISTNGKAPLHSHINHNTPQFLYSLWRRANARNVSFLNLSRW